MRLEEVGESLELGIAGGGEKKADKGRLHAPAAFSEDADTPEQRANVGTAGNLPFAAALAVVPIVIMIVYLMGARAAGAFESL